VSLNPPRSESVTTRSASRASPSASSSTSPGRRSANVDPMHVTRRGSATLVGGFLGVAVSTSVDVGPFVALLGGLILLTGGAAASRESP
jgi:uncharacterized membrane protein YfcA